jgi:hypothetical protein
LCVGAGVSAGQSRWVRVDAGRCRSVRVSVVGTVGGNVGDGVGTGVERSVRGGVGDGVGGSVGHRVGGSDGDGMGDQLWRLRQSKWSYLRARAVHASKNCTRVCPFIVLLIRFNFKVVLFQFCFTRSHHESASFRPPPN